VTSAYTFSHKSTNSLKDLFVILNCSSLYVSGEKACSIHGHGEHWVASSNCIRGNTEIEPDTMVKLVRKGCIRYGPFS